MSRLMLNFGVFPCWRHSKHGESVLIHSEAECEALGDDWADTPAAFDIEKQEEKQKEDTKPERKKPGRKPKVHQ